MLGHYDAWTKLGKQWLSRNVHDCTVCILSLYVCMYVQNLKRVS